MSKSNGQDVSAMFGGKVKDVGGGKTPEVKAPATQQLDMAAEIARLKAENDALKAKAAERQVITLKVSEKGALSVYGLGRFPVTLYAQQWEKLLSQSGRIAEYIKANASQLSRKE